MNLGIETETLEFKKSTGELKGAMNSICAILNKHQKGELYFGIRSDGTPIGQVVTEESLRDVSQRISNSIEPRIYPEIKKVTIDDKDCIYVSFEGQDVPYFAYGVAKIRVADEDITLSPTELSEYIRKKQLNENKWENLVSNKTIDYVDEDLLKQYIKHAHEVGRLVITYTDKQTVLNQLGLTKGDNLLNAGKVLFSDDISQDIQMAIFATTERLTFNDIQRHHGPVTKLVDLAETYIKNNIHWKVEFDGSRERKEIPEIPMDAVREALLNSFCHKDYSTGQSNEVAIYKDRVEIYNPGSFPVGYEPKDFIERPERPIRRNPTIARILYYSKNIESFGTGLKRIVEACDKARVNYEFKMLKSGFVVCFYRNNIEYYIDKVEKYDTVNDTANDTVNDKLNRIFSRRQKEKVLLMISQMRKYPEITLDELAETIGMSRRTVARYIKDLKRLNIIERKGTDKVGKWIVRM